MKYILLTVVILIGLSFACNIDKSTLNWVQETKEAAWQARDSQGEFEFNGHMWMLGGWFTPQLPNPRDVWKSSDGKKWSQVTETAPWEHSDLSAAMVFKNRMWMMGGRKLPGTECSNQVWSSADGSNWTLETANAGWSPRLAPGFLVFKERMWILGGTSDFYQNNDTTMFNDVWSSEDGINWNLVSDSAAWKPRLWFSTLVYRDRMWVLGGWEEAGNLGDVWYSKDGQKWTELKTDSVWSKRHEHSAFVFNDKMWIAGGAAEPKYLLDSEVWSLSIPRKWFLD